MMRRRRQLFPSGRGSTCINTGREKVFPEEVEQALKVHPAVLDALVAGIPDGRFGERVAAVVELRPDAATAPDELREHCRAALAGYKVPCQDRVRAARAALSDRTGGLPLGPFRSCLTNRFPDRARANQAAFRPGGAAPGA